MPELIIGLCGIIFGLFIIYFVNRRIRLREFREKYDCSEAKGIDGGPIDHFMGICFCTKVAVGKGLAERIYADLGQKRPMDEQAKQWLVKNGLLKPATGGADIMVVPTMPSNDIEIIC